ncbi:hypothetical protein [Pontivivens ytuae]|uniref:Uncharacterized protein n=1 Tax=Pontivivens ytuae TaxID=2789856 RepID=A0A7S9LQE5_9RHOB|nr:hypothetical protein [Pontivivens ytuae]QPH53209.1 hypothetical protein I0K15_15620 [Pontivivens ytuae]
MTKAPKPASLFAAQDTGSLIAVVIALPDPTMDRRHAGFELTCQILGTFNGSVQLDDMLPQSSRLNNLDQR